MASSTGPLEAIQSTLAEADLEHDDGTEPQSEMAVSSVCDSSTTGRPYEIIELNDNNSQISSTSFSSTILLSADLPEQDENVSLLNGKKSARTTENVVDPTDGANVRGTINLVQPLTPSPECKKAEIDTAAPFESVKAALTLFGERFDGKSQQQTRQTQVPSFERNTVSEVDLQRIQDDIAIYKKRLSDTNVTTGDILVELESVKEQIEAGSGKSKDGMILNFVHFSEMEVAEASESVEDVKVASQRATEMLKVMKDIENMEEKLLSLKASRDMAKKRLEQSCISFDSVSKTNEELVEEQASLLEAMSSAQSELVDVEEKVELLRSGENLELLKTRHSNLIDRLTAEMKLLQLKLEKTNSAVRKLREELAAAKELDIKSLANIEVKEDIQKVRLQLDEAKYEKQGNVEKLAKISAELDHVKPKLQKAREEHASLSSSLLSLQEEKEKARIELESMHETEQVACATLASLQDELQKVKESLLSSQDGARRALEAKETLPAAIKQAALEADKAKAQAEGSIVEERRARHEVDQSKAAMSTTLSQNAATLKEVEAARASETIALAEFKGLIKSEERDETDMETESKRGTVIVIPSEEYNSLKQAAEKAEGMAGKKVEEVLALVKRAKSDHIAAQARLDDVLKKVGLSRKELEEVLKSGEDAQVTKLACEAALRKWRSEHEQQRQRTGIPPNHHLCERKLRNDEHSPDVEKPDPVAQDFGRIIPIPERSTGTDYLPMELEGVSSQDKEKLKKKTFMKRLTSAVSRKKAQD